MAGKIKDNLLLYREINVLAVHELQAMRSRQVDSDPFSEVGLYAFKSRAKASQSLRNKVADKRLKGRDWYSPLDATDVIGCRLIALYPSDVIETTRLLLQHYCDVRDGQHGMLNFKELVELIVFTGNKAHDPIEKGVKELTDGMDASIREVVKFTDKSSPEDLESSSCGATRSDEGSSPANNRSSVYSSVHIVFRVNSMLPDESMGFLRDSGVEPGELQRYRDWRLPVEFQIRTLFEDCWGEIDHKLRFKPAGAKGQVSPASDRLSGQLRALKTLMDGCAELADCARESYGELVSEGATSKGETIDLNREEASAAVLLNNGLSAEEVGKISKLISARKRIQSNDSEPSRAGRIDSLRSLASKFDEVGRQLMTDKGRTETLRLSIETLITLESAFCLLIAGTASDLEKADQLYASIHQKNEATLPVVAVRRAQVAFRRTQIADSAEQSEKAFADMDIWVQRAEESLALMSDGGFADDLVDQTIMADPASLNALLYRMKTLRAWRKARSLKEVDPQKALEELGLALKYSEQDLAVGGGLADPEQSAENNLVTILGQMADPRDVYRSELGENRLADVIDEIRKRVESVERRAEDLRKLYESRPGDERIRLRLLRRLDSLNLAYRAIGDNAKAMRFARELESILLDRMATDGVRITLDESEKRMLHQAVDTIGLGAQT